MFSRRRSDLLVVAALLLTMTGTAHAEQSAEALAEQAIQAYEKGDLTKASALFLEAYQISQEATQLRNGAKATEEDGRLEEALSLWKRYAALTTISADEVAEAEARIALIEEKRKTLALQQKVETEKQQREAAEAAEREMAERLATPAPPPAEPSVLPYVTIGAGVATLAVSGVFFGLSTSRLSALDDDLATRDTNGNVTGISKSAAQDELDAINGQRVIAGTTLGVGLAAVAAGIIWAALD